MNNLTIKYCTGSDTIRASNNALVAHKVNNRWVLDIDGSIELHNAQLLFTRWFQIHTYADPILLAKTLNDALNHTLQITIGGIDVYMYDGVGVFNYSGIQRAVIDVGLCTINDKFNAQHCVAGSHVRTWVNDSILDDYNIWS